MFELTKTIGRIAYSHNPKMLAEFNHLVAEMELAEATKALNRIQNKLTKVELENAGRPRKGKV